MLTIDEVNSEFEISKVAPFIGAEISNIDLSIPQSDEVMDNIHQALLDHKVLVFRNQDISTEEQLAFASYFGELEVHPFFTYNPAHPEIVAITQEDAGSENYWYSDVSWRPAPSFASVLRVLTVPESGGDTLFANMEMAYDHLSEDLKSRLEGRTAIHDVTLFKGYLENFGILPEKIEALMTQHPEVEHPIIRIHPETGRKSIYVNSAFTQRIVDMDKDESDAVLAYLFNQASVPDYGCRIKWQSNSVALWDNRACQHYTFADYWPQQRHVERVTIKGSKPI